MNIDHARAGTASRPLPTPGPTSAWDKELLDGRPLRVLPRPHYRLEGEALYFMASTRPHCNLSASELAVWQAIQSPVTLQELHQRFPENAAEVVHTLWHRELCEFVETTFAPGRRRVLVIEPHPDDAALSIAGVMWSRRHECEFTLATMAGRSNYTSYYNLEREYFDIERVAALRRQESQLFVSMLGGRHVDIGRTDAALRYRDNVNWSLDYFRRTKMAIAVATSRTADPVERSKWSQDVQSLLASTPSDEVWFPLGAPHSDHVLTMNACLAALVSNPRLVEGREIKIFQDVPYAARTPDFSEEMLSTLAGVGVKMDPESVPIADVFEQKLRLVSVYASQFKIRAMRDDIEASAGAHGPGSALSELLWTVRELPSRVDEGGIVPASIDKQEQERAAQRWLARNRDARRVRVLLLLPTGRWASDLSRLRQAFPKARFEIFASPAAASEVRESPSGDVDLVPVGEGTRAWALLALKLVVAKPVPTLFHVGDKRLQAARGLSRLWPLSDTVVVSSMNRLMRVVERGSLATSEQASESAAT